MNLSKILKDNLPIISAFAAILMIVVFSRILEPTLAIGLVGMIVAVVILFAALVKKPENALFLMAFFLPFERIPSFEISGMSLKINHIIALVALVAMVTAGVVGHRKIKSDPILPIIFLLLADIAFSITYAQSTSRAISVFLFMCLMVVAYFTVKSLINKKRDILLILRGLLAGAMVVALFGIFQFLGDSVGLPESVTLLKRGYGSITFGFARVQGASQEPLYFANYIFIPLLISVSMLVGGKLKEVIPRWAGVLLIILLSLNFILAISRGAILAAAIVFVLFVIFRYKKLLTVRVLIPATVLVFMIITGAYLGLLRSEPRAIDEFVGHLFVNDAKVGESVVSRLGAIDQAADLFWDNPILGVGIGNFGPATQGDTGEVPEGGWFIVNNEYLELLAENGIVGFIIFALLITAVTYYAIKAIRRGSGSLVASSLEGSLLALYAILFQYLTFSTLYIFHLWFLLAFIAGQSAYILDQGKNEI